MKICAVDLLHLCLTLKAPFETSQGRVTTKETVVVRATSDSGLKGYGEAPAFALPTYTYETVDTILLALERYLVPSVLNVDLSDIESFARACGWVKGYHMAKCGLEGAFWDIRAQEEGLPVWKLWDGTRDRVEVGISLGSEEDARTLVRRIEQAVDSGYRRVKIKIKPGRDVEVVKVVREALPNVTLMVDANGSYTLDDTERLKRLDQFDLLMIEQPLAEDDLVDHAVLQSVLDTQLCLDESIESRADARSAINMDAARIINIKPSRVGGYWEARLMATECAAAGVPVWCGGMLETGIGKAFNLHLSSLGAFSLPGDTSGTDRYFEQDVIQEPIVVDADSCIAVPQAPGLGVDVDEAALRDLLVDSISLRS